MLPIQRRGGSQAEEQLQDNLPEQQQDDVTVATVDSYQVRLAMLLSHHHCDCLFSFIDTHQTG